MPDSRSSRLSTIIGIDNICSDILIDQIWIYFNTRKFEAFGRYYPRRLRKSHNDLIELIRQNCILASSPQAAFKDLEIELEREMKDEFKRKFARKHMCLYLNLYAVSAGVEVVPAPRYGESDVKVIATRSFKVGEKISCLSGYLTKLTSQDEILLETSSRNSFFSIIHSHRKQSRCIFIGPARFVNHDCDPNTRFVTSGDTIGFEVIRPVSIEEEIVTYYSDNYFGSGNIECMCHSCEKNNQGKFSEALPLYDSSSELTDYSESEFTDILSLVRPSRKRHSEEKQQVSIIAEDSISPNADLDPNSCLHCHKAIAKSSELLVCTRCFVHSSLYHCAWPQRAKSSILDLSTLKKTRKVSNCIRKPASKKKKPGWTYCSEKAYMAKLRREKFFFQI